MSERWTEAQLAQALASRNNTTKFSIGIDPGKSTGFAVWNKLERRFQVIETIDFWSAHNQALQYPTTETVISVEVPKTKASFHGKSSHTQSVNIGMVIREAMLIAEGLRRAGYSVTEVHPKGKVDAAYFKRVTGHAGRTSEHARDAGMLAFNV